MTHQLSVAVNSVWVLIAALLVIFMQAGFALLEIGFSRQKNAGGHIWVHPGHGGGSVFAFTWPAD